MARLREGRLGGRLLRVSHQATASKLWNPKEGSGFLNCCADSDDGTFRNRNKIVMKRMSTDHSLSARLCVQCFLHIVLLNAHMVSAVLILQRRKLKLTEVKFVF